MPPTLQKIAQFLSSIEIWIVSILIGISLLSTRTLPWVVFVIGVLWLVRWVGMGRLTLRTPLDLPVGLIILMIPVTMWVTILPDISSIQVLRLLSGIGLFYTIINWTNTEKRYRLLVNGLLTAGIGLCFFALFSVDWVGRSKIPLIPLELYSRFHVLVSDSVHPNVMAGTLLILFPVALAVLIFSWKDLRWYERLLAIVMSSGSIGIIFLTQSRGAILTLVIVLIGMLIARWRRVGAIVMSAAIVGGIMLVTKLGIDRTLNLLIANVTLGGIDGRLEVWSRAFYMLRDFPFTGIGMGTFTTIADTFYPFSIFTAGSVSHAHNLFLQIAVDLGIPGLIAWLSCLIIIICGAWLIFRKNNRPADRWMASLGLGLLFSQIALVLHGMLDSVTWGMVRPAPLVWGLWGLTMAGFSLLQRKAESGAADQSD
jgi:O-antigen ligase